MNETQAAQKPSCCGDAAVAASVPAPASPISGAFNLIDHHGNPVNERSYGGQHLLVFFGFTHCAVVCPRELGKLSRMLGLLGARAAQLQLLYVTVDPLRDTPAVMRSYLAAIDPRFIGLTGAVEQIDGAKKAYRAFAATVVDPSAPGGYVVPHSAFAYFMAPGGHFKAHFADSLSAEEVARRIGRLLDAKGDTSMDREVSMDRQALLDRRAS
jgi:protein SCO1